MVKAVNFTVRNSAGVVTHGAIAENAPSAVVAVGAGEAVSLNLSKAEIVRYERVGNDLQVVLADGRVITLDNYFAAAGNELYLSSDGTISQVILGDAPQGVLYADYGPAGGFEKWSPVDTMTYGSADPVVASAGDEVAMAPFIPALVGGMGGMGGAGLAAAGLVGAGLLTAGGGGGTAPNSNPGTTPGTSPGTSPETNPGTNPGNGGPAPDTTPPVVAVTKGTGSTNTVVNIEDAKDGATITGTGEAGNTITVTTGGSTLTTTVTPGGTWTVTVPANQITVGEYTQPVKIVATDAAGNSTTRTDTLVVDTVAPPLTIHSVTADNVLSGAEWTSGFSLTGTSTPGGVVTVTYGSITRTVTTGANGTWTLPFSKADFAGGEYTGTFTASTVDAAGNPNSTSHSFTVDTVGRVALQTTPIAADDIINGAEHAGAVTVTGTSEPGSTVFVTLGGVRMQAVVAPNGNWTATYAANALPPGEYNTTASVEARDAYGNTSSASRAVRVDTLGHVALGAGQAGGDNTISSAEQQAGVRLTGTAEAGSTVQVTFQGHTHTVTADGNGNWSSVFTSAEVGRGTFDAPVSVRATDIAGNVATTSGSLHIDTDGPGAPDITHFTRATSSATAGVISLRTSGAVTDIDEITAAGAVKDITYQSAPVFGKVEHDFSASPVPDGSYLVVANTDAVGNISNTLVVINNTSGSVLDLSRPGVSGFDIDKIDLVSAPNATLTVTEAQLKAVTGPDMRLVVTGDTLDTVTATGAVDTGTNQTIDGRSYSVYTLGTDGATLIVDDAVRMVI